MQIPIEKAKRAVTVHSKKGKVFTQLREEAKFDEVEHFANEKKISKELKQEYGSDKTYNEMFKEFMGEAESALMFQVNKAISMGSTFSKPEIIQHMTMFLHKKFEQYSPKLSNPKTFTNLCVAQEVFWMNRPSNFNNTEWQLLKKIKALKNEALKSGETLTSTQLAKTLKTKEARIEEILQKSQPIRSLDEVRSNDLMLGDLVMTNNELDDPELAFEHAQVNEMMINALQGLTKEEQDVINLSTGYPDGKILNDAQIAKTLKTNPVQIKRIRDKAIQKLRNSPLGELNKSLDNIEKIIIMYRLHLDRLKEALDANYDVNDILVETIKSLSIKIDERLQQIQKSTKEIRIRQRDPKIFDRKTLRTTNLTKSINAVIGQLPNDNKLRVQTLIFNTDSSKGETWNLKKAKEWAKLNKSQLKISVDINDLLEKCQNKLNSISK